MNGGKSFSVDSFGIGYFFMSLFFALPSPIVYFYSDTVFLLCCILTGRREGLNLNERMYLPG